MDGYKSTGGGRKFLSKVVRFVKNPTTQWSQLDRPADVKDLIERKKRDDLLRSRELSALRKQLKPKPYERAARRAAPRPAGDGGDARTQTLRQKIEALDAQMTRRGPLGHTQQPAQAAPAAQAADDVTTPAPPPARSGSQAMQLDPEIEEVAIHFANGNFGDAESGLLRLVDSPGTRREEAQVWLMLFDLYRATGQANKFSDLGVEFANHFERSAPQWLRRLGAAEGAGNGAPSRGSAAGTDKVDWRAPPWLDEPALAYLQASLTQDTTEWCVDWRGLETIDPAALPKVIDVLQHWAGKTMILTCLGVSRLADLLAEKTLTHERDVDPNWWLARLALLRLLNQMDAFDETALAYCITYEVSPPAWTDPLARVVLPDAEEVEQDGLAPTVFMPENLGRADADGVLRLQLAGEILGDIDELVGALTLTQEVRTIECDCLNLRRVDFGAVGALFNWVMDQQGRGRHVVFIDVHRLVAAFFGVIGIADVTAVIRVDD